jgi:hypothetical protein
LEKIPAFLRWVLLFPLAGLVVLLAGFIIRIAVLSGGLPIVVFNVVFPPIMALIYLFIIFHLAPGIKKALLLIVIILRSLFIPILIAGIIFHFVGLDVQLSWNDNWAPLLGEILTLVASIWLYLEFKKQLPIKSLEQSPLASSDDNIEPPGS